MKPDMKPESKNLKSQRGQSLIEYLVIVALVAVGAISIMGTVGQSVEVAFGRVAKSLGADTPTEIRNAKVSDSQLKKRNLRNFMSGSLKSESGSDSGDSSGDNQ